MFFAPGACFRSGTARCAIKTSKFRQGKPTVHQVLWLLRMKGLRKAYKILRHYLDDASAWAVNVRDEEE
jgi:hypothetical protein